MNDGGAWNEETIRRASEALDGLNDDAWSIDVLTVTETWSGIVRDLLKAYEDIATTLAFSEDNAALFKGLFDRDMPKIRAELVGALAAIQRVKDLAALLERSPIRADEPTLEAELIRAALQGDREA